ncbi:hypothetical protein PT2222_330045 [Paraburkholderia tropica]
MVPASAPPPVFTACAPWALREVREHGLRRETRLRQLRVEVVGAAVAEADHDERRQALIGQTEFRVERSGVETFHRAGVDFERRRADQHRTQRQIRLLFHPRRQIVALAMQVHVEIARVRLPRLRFGAREAAIGLFLREHGVQMRLVHVLAHAQHEHVRSLQHLRLVVCVAGLHGLRHARAGRVAFGHHEMPGLRVHRRRAEADQLLQFVDDRGRDLAGGIERLGRVARLGEAGEVQNILLNRCEV